MTILNRHWIHLPGQLAKISAAIKLAREKAPKRPVELRCYGSGDARLWIMAWDDVKLMMGG